MSEILTKAVWNGDTGETEIVPLTAEEIADREVQTAAAAIQKEEQELAALQVEEDRQAAIDHLKGLGMTDAMIAAIVK
jgi:hypothetical protein